MGVDVIHSDDKLFELMDVYMYRGLVQMKDGILSQHARTWLRLATSQLHHNIIFIDWG